ncbi:MAG: flagellar motor protein MotB [Planctomycetota bacterium]|jgi:chemotaxis protein MotB
MSHRKKEEGLEDAPGAPEWMVTFSDCMTLLLTFFVLLLSFSSFDEAIFSHLKVIFAKSLPSVKQADAKDRAALLRAEQIEATTDLDRGSEKSTLSKGRKDNLKEETEPVDFKSRKIFLIPSKKVFWGKGKAISSGGRSIMANVGSFLREIPARIVISENGWGEEDTSEHFGLPRAWAVVQYLTITESLDKKRFSVSASSAVVQQNTEDSKRNRPGAAGERMLEIVLLEGSIYN